MLEKIQLLKEWIAAGQVVTKFRNRSEDDLITLVNQLEIEAKNLAQIAFRGEVTLSKIPNEFCQCPNPLLHDINCPLNNQ